MSADTIRIFMLKLYNREENSSDGVLFIEIGESGKTKCYAQIKRNVIFSSKTKCNKIKTHTKPRGRFETNIQTDLFLYTEFKHH